MSVRRLVLLGPPGAGKGTQAAKLAERLGVPQIATGDMFREAVARDTEVGRQARGYMDRGELVPDDVVIAVAKERLSREDARSGFVLDGFPRTVEQARALDAILERLEAPLEVCVSLRVDENELVERLLRRADIEGRSDDNESTIRNRMRVYRAQTEPLIAYYRGQDLLRDVDGVGTLEEVAKRLEEALSR